jgi:hypothetical protein
MTKPGSDAVKRQGSILSAFQSAHAKGRGAWSFRAAQCACSARVEVRTEGDAEQRGADTRACACACEACGGAFSVDIALSTFVLL